MFPPLRRQFRPNIRNTSSWSVWEWPHTRLSETSTALPEQPHAQKLASQLPGMDTKKAIEVLMKFTSERRAQTFRRCLQLRTSRVRTLFESPSNYNNVFASLRTLDSFGVHHTDIVNTSGKRGKGNSRRQSMLSSLGAIKWLSINHHTKAAKDVILELKKREPELCVFVSDIHSKNSQSLYDLDWTSKHPKVVVFGNEELGVSDEVRAIADVSFYIPMKGLAESLNLSASVAVTFATLERQGALTPNLSDSEMDSILLQWLISSVKGGEAILRREFRQPGLPS